MNTFITFFLFFYMYSAHITQSLCGIWVINRLYINEEIIYDSHDIKIGAANFFKMQNRTDSIMKKYWKDSIKDQSFEYRKYKEFVEQISLVFNRNKKFTFLIPIKDRVDSLSGRVEQTEDHGKLIFIDNNSNSQSVDFYLDDSLLQFTNLNIRYIFVRSKNDRPR